MKKRPSLKSPITGLIVSVVAMFMVLSLPVQAKTISVISGFPKTHLFTSGCLGIFEKNLVQISDGNLKLNISGPDVVPTNEQFQPLQAGVFDLLFTHAAYHLGDTAIGAAIEAIDPDPVKRRESGVIDYVDDQYNKIGVKFLASLPITQYNIILRDPIKDQEPSLKGLKIRTASLVAPAIKALGGAPVNLSPGEIYTSLQKGVIDGFSLVAVGLKDYKIHEVAGYLVRPKFAFISASVFMNLDKFKALTEQEKEWIKKAAIKSEIDTFAYFKKKHNEEVLELKALGMKETLLNPADAQKIERVFNGTVWAVTEKKSGEQVTKLHQMVLEKGMTR